MNPEQAVLKLLLNATTRKRYRGAVNLGNARQNARHIYQLYLSLDELSVRFPDRDFSVDDLFAFHYTQYPAMRQEERDALDDVAIAIKGSTVDEMVAGALLEEMHLRAQAAKLALQAYEVSTGKISATDFRAAVQEYGTAGPTVLPDATQSFVTDDLDDLYHSTYAEQGLRWRLDSLNRRLGSLRAGDFGFVFKRPETGGTTFLASEVTHMAGQTDRPILWINNEEQGKKVKVRVYQAALGCDTATLFAHRPTSRAKYLELTRDLIRVVDEASIGRSQIEDLAASLEPVLVVIDQLPKVKGFVADRNDLRLGAIFQWARELAKTYACAVVGVAQADGSAEGVKYLNMDHVADAKTAVQAEADFILGIGKSNDAGYDYMRYFSLCKNKLMGDEDSDPSLRHDRWDVVIEPMIARFKDFNRKER